MASPPVSSVDLEGRCAVVVGGRDGWRVMLGRWWPVAGMVGTLVFLASCAGGGGGGGGVSVSVTPPAVILAPSASVEFTAILVGGTEAGVTWSSTAGTLVPTGMTASFTAPAEPGAYVVTATSNADASKSGSATVTVQGGGSGFVPAPSYISIANLVLGAATGGSRRLSFDIAWNESWRGPLRPSWVAASDNWDAAWVFVKFRVDGGAWRHATLAAAGHVVPAGAVVEVPADRVGAFLFRSDSGYGTFSVTGLGLAWDYVADGVAAGANVEVRPLAIEMVYVPHGSFSLGSGGANIGEFRAGGTSSTPFVVSDPSPIALGSAVGQMNWTSFTFTGSPSGATNPSFPTGFAASYVMKHQVTQGQYVDFLNTLKQAQADARKHTGASNRYAITGSIVGSYGSTLPFVAMSNMSWGDGAAFADWAGLRPLTELEYEKVARGPLAPVGNEFPWGSTSITRATGLVNAGTIAEMPSPSAANANYADGVNPIQGPVRVGSFAAPGRSRRDAGAGYYGALELGGNLYERHVTVGNAAGRAFAGTHGDGGLDASGNANVTSWPGATAEGAGFRGGVWNDDVVNLRLSNRSDAGHASPGRFSIGWRAARSAP